MLELDVVGREPQRSYRQQTSSMQRQAQVTGGSWCVCKVKRRSVIRVVCVPAARLERSVLRSPRAWIGRQREGLRTPCRENPGLAALAVRTFLLKFETSSPWRSSLLYPTPCGRLCRPAPALPALKWWVRCGDLTRSGGVNVHGTEGRPVTAAGGEVQHSGQAWLRTAALPRCRSPGTGLLSGGRPDSS